MILDATSEKLRSKHVRTLELLQKTLDENVELRDRVAQLQKGQLHLSNLPSKPSPRHVLQAPPLSPTQVSNCTRELQEEIERLKAAHHAKVQATEAQMRDLRAAMQVLEKQNNELTKEWRTADTALGCVRDTLKAERDDWNTQIQQFLKQQAALETQVAQLQSPQQQTEHQQIVDQLAHDLRELQTKSHAQETQYTQLRHDHEQLKHEHQRLTTQHNQQAQLVRQYQTDAASTQQQIQTLSQQLALSSEREKSMADDLVQSRAQKQELQKKLSQQQLALTTAQQTHATKVTQLEDKIAKLVHENTAQREEMQRLSAQVADLACGSQAVGLPPPGATSSNASAFAMHVDLKRENFQLKQQIEELKAIQRRFLTTAKKKNVSFTSLK